jgi:hypothetical protein
MAMTASPHQIVSAIADAYKAEQTRIIMTLSAVMQRVDDEDENIEEQAAIECLADSLIGEFDKVTEDYIDYVVKGFYEG